MHELGILARRVLRVAPVAGEDGRKLLDNVLQVEGLAVQLVAAAVANPKESVQLMRQPAPLQHEPDGLGGPLRRMWDPRRQQEDFPLADGNIAWLSLLEDA